MTTLYKKTTTGAIQEWSIDCIGNVILTTFGQLNGAMQKVQETITKGNQGRDLIQQAEFNVEALIKSKRNSGYKQLLEIGIYQRNNLFYLLEPQEEKDAKGYSLEYLLDALLETEATDINGNVKPMLAQPIITEKVVKGEKIIKSHWKKVTYPIAGEPKLDGVRCLIFVDSISKKVTALSREGKSYDFGTTKIRETLSTLFKDFPDVILDGELYVHGMPQNRISGSMRGGKYIPETHDIMDYHVYDIVDTTSTYSERRSKLVELAIIYKSFNLGKQAILQNKEEIDAYEIQCITEGYEGIMLKPLAGKYEIGKRSYNNLKVKQFLEEEFVIVGYELGKRGSRDLIFHCKTKEDNLFKPTATGTSEQKEAYYRELHLDQLGRMPKTIIGKNATVKFKFYSEFGVPNHCNVKTIRDYE